jgi:hypothetical protein
MDTEVDNEEMPPLDMTDASPEEVLKVFKAMGDQDGIIVKKDGPYVHLSDTDENKDYLIQVEANKRRQMKSKLNEEILYELSFDSDEDEMEGFEDLDELEGHEDMGDFDEDVVYELEMDETAFDTDSDSDLAKDEFNEMDEKLPNPFGDEVKESFKPKGRVGKMKFKYPSKLKKGVAETAFEDEVEEEWKESKDEDLVEYEEEGTAEKSEASRTLGNGRKWGRKGLPKPRTAPRHLSVESVNSEVTMLREKNEEYKKALDFFRNKLNEVAVFNSNLAYSTRLFTEHSTTKQEKINILRRFDNVETLKESKNLYKTIKNELDGTGSTNVVKESIAEQVVKTPQTGSATNLIESKTYENPQFLRMKDLMAKIK